MMSMCWLSVTFVSSQYGYISKMIILQVYLQHFWFQQRHEPWLPKKIITLPLKLKESNVHWEMSNSFSSMGMSERYWDVVWHSKNNVQYKAYVLPDTWIVYLNLSSPHSLVWSIHVYLAHHTNLGQQAAMKSLFSKIQTPKTSQSQQPFKC